MRKFITISLLFFTVQYLSAQVYKFNAYEVAFYDNEIEKWQPFEETQILISLNVDAKKVKIYSKETQTFDIIKTHDKTVDEDGDETFRFYCEDQDGVNSYLDFTILNSQAGRRQVYVIYNNFKYVYNMENAN